MTTLACVAAVLLPVGACSKEEKKAGLVVAVQTDMSIPKDVTAVEIDISVYGKPVFNERYEIGDDGIYIPATLTLLPPNESGAPVTIRVLSYKKDEVRTLRRVVTTVPENREALLRMPIQWLCEGETKKSGDEVASSCDEGESCLVGSCATDAVDSAELPDFEAAFVFGGARGDRKGACFDTVPCFAQKVPAETLGFDPDTCTATLTGMDGAGGASPGPEKLNFALESDAGDGICQDGWGCFIPLDRDPVIGWSVEGSTVKVPPGLCRRLKDGAGLHFVASTACDTKTADIPTCGPWSSVEGTSITVDLSGLTPGGAGGEGGAGTGGAGTGGVVTNPPVPDPCGDGSIGSGEECDDGNPVAGDGCSASCQIEPWYLCAEEPSVCDLRGPGDLFSNALELVSGIYSMSGMVGENGVLSPQDVYFVGTRQPQKNVRIAVNAPFAGELLISDVASQCAGASCTGVTRKRQLVVGENTEIVIHEGFTSFALRIVASESTSADFTLTALVEDADCGDGIKSSELGEECDDGNSIGEDGCSDLCAVEMYWTCADAVDGEGSECVPIPL